MYALAAEIENTKAAVAGFDAVVSLDEERQRALDMQAALSELAAISEERRAQDPGLIPTIDRFPPER